MKRKTFIQAVALASAAAHPALSAAKTDAPFRLDTPLCRLLDIRYPILQAGMSEVAGPELVAAVCNAGGFGILTATMVPPDVLRDRLDRVRRLTDRPFGVNLILHRDLFPPAEFEIDPSDALAVHRVLNGFRAKLGIPSANGIPPKLPPLIQSAFELILEERPAAFSIGLGNPTREMVDACHDRGIKVIAMICTVEDALAVAENGVDVVIAQGSEAGGHRSTWFKRASPELASIGTLPLTAAVADAVRQPVVAAGGIVDGRGLKAALDLGAQGVLMGTRFIATKESMAPESYKTRILEGTGDQTTVTDVFTGMYARVLRNDFTEEYRSSGAPVLPPGRQYAAAVDVVRAAAVRDNAGYNALYAGQGIDGIREIRTASEVVEAIVAEALHSTIASE